MVASGLHPRHHAGTSRQQAGPVASACALLRGMLAALLVFSANRDSNRRRALLQVALLSFFAGALSPVSARADEWNATFKPARSYIMLQSITLRAGPANSSKSVGRVERDTVVAVHALVNGWCQLTTRNGQSGYIFKRYLKPVPGAPAPGSPASASSAPVARPESSATPPGAPEHQEEISNSEYRSAAAAELAAVARPGATPSQPAPAPPPASSRTLPSQKSSPAPVPAPATGQLPEPPRPEIRVVASRGSKIKPLSPPALPKVPPPPPPPAEAPPPDSAASAQPMDNFAELTGPAIAQDEPPAGPKVSAGAPPPLSSPVASPPPAPVASAPQSPAPSEAAPPPPQVAPASVVAAAPPLPQQDPETRSDQPSSQPGPELAALTEPARPSPPAIERDKKNGAGRSKPLDTAGCKRYFSLRFANGQGAVSTQNTLTGDGPHCYRLLTLKKNDLSITLTAEADAARFDVYAPIEGQLAVDKLSWFWSVDRSGDKIIVVHAATPPVGYELKVRVSGE